jgi:hypothetical protein
LFIGAAASTIARGWVSAQRCRRYMGRYCCDGRGVLVMKKRTGVVLAFVLAFVLILAMCGSSLAVPALFSDGKTKDPDKPNPIAMKTLRNDLNPGLWAAGVDVVPKVDNILTILVEFAGSGDMPGHNDVGPLHNTIEAPAKGDNTSYWIPDFSPAHYVDMLFSSAAGAKSMRNYFLDQSGGLLTVTGQVYGWITLPHSEAYYGANTGTSSIADVVYDAVQAGRTPRAT